MLERTSTPISLPKKRPPSWWWVGPQVMAKHGGENTTVKLNQPGKGSTFRALVVRWHLWDLEVTTFFRGNVWMNIFGFWPQVGGWQVHELTKREMFGSRRKWQILHSHLHTADPIVYSLFGSIYHLQTYHSHITPLLYVQTIHHTCAYHVNKMHSTTVRYDCSVLLYWL